MVAEFSTETFLLIGSILFFTSMFIGNTGHKFGVPILLLFLGVGIMFGSFGLRFENAQVAEAIGVICLCIILFSGGLDTKFAEIKRIIAPGVVLATIGVVLTSFITGYFTWWLSNNFFGGTAVSLITALLLASTCSSTDSASVFGILRSKGLSLKNNLRPLLELESGSNDPVAYILTLMFITIIQSGEAPNIPMVTGTMLIQLIIGGLLGFFFGKLAIIVINKARIENESLYAVLVLTVCIFVFSATYFLKGNGYLAVYIAGLVIGNHKFVHKRSVMKFMDGFAWLSQILLFLTLGLLVNPAELLDVLWIGIIIGLFMIFVARPLTIFITLLPFKNIKLKDQTFISWVGLRGAVPIIFAIMPLAAGIPGARWIFNIVFVITIVSLLVQGTTLPLVAKLLNLANKPNKFKQIGDFDMEFSEEIKSAMTEILITEETLTHGKNLMEMPLPNKTLAVMVKRGEKFFIPTGKTELMANDKLLVISDDEDALRETYKNIGIQSYSYKKNR
ncbi:MAG: potassium/proton antiporter [Dysgonamonadaceae bacterium]|jgi:cell volume regulation protein A|nr:potassium/proton antiporter [Dysgonamonadaceae bacterium]